MTGYRRPLQDRSKRTFESLLDAAGHLLAEVGLERISANLICERAGVTPPAFYRYFDDKQAIMLALAERVLERQTVILNAWVERYRDSGLETLAQAGVTLMRELNAVTAAAPEWLWVMRALHAMPALSHIRLMAHNACADLLTDVYMPYLPHVPREVVRRRTRMSVEIAYAMDEMVKEGEADPELLYKDAAHVFQAMFHYPDYAT